MLSVAAATRWQASVGIGRGAENLSGKRKSECDQQRNGQHSAKHAFQYSEGSPARGDDERRMRPRKAESEATAKTTQSLEVIEG
jgi:hypothetical protein